MSDGKSRAEIAKQEELKTRKHIERAGAGDQSQVGSAPSPADIAWKSADDDRQEDGGQRDTD